MVSTPASFRSDPGSPVDLVQNLNFQSSPDLNPQNYLFGLFNDSDISPLISCSIHAKFVFSELLGCN